jgi:hypothetical protein
MDQVGVQSIAGLKATWSWQLEQHLQVRVSPNHLENQGNEFALAASCQARFQVLNLLERLWFVQPGQEQGSGVFAPTTSSHRAGAMTRHDAFQT